MTIKEIEERTCLDRANIRFYEKEGLLSPERLENGYRDYTEADVKTLLRIKLLRSLHLPLEEIRALQRGDKTLSDAMAQHLHTLEKERQRVAAAEDVCRAMQTDRVLFSTLDAGKYLDRLTRGPKTEVVQYTLPKTDTYRPPMHPWRRYFARTLDYNLYLMPIELFILLVCHVNPNTQLGVVLSVFAPYGAFALMYLIEPLLLHFFGTTPGKWLFGLRLTQLHGVKLSLQNTRRRTWEVLWRGYGLGIPILSLIRLWNCYKLCVAGQEQDWDEFPRNRLYVIRDTKPWRGAAYFAAATGFLLINLWATDASSLPPNRGDLTVAEFAENYNFICTYEYGNYPAYMLDQDGNWVDLSSWQMPGHYYMPGGDTMKFYATEAFGPSGFRSTLRDKPPPQLEFETDPDGNIISITMKARRALIMDVLYAEDFRLLAQAFVRAQPGGGPFSGTQQQLSTRLERLPSDAEFTLAGVTVQVHLEYLNDDALSYAFSLTKPPQT